MPRRHRLSIVPLISFIMSLLLTASLAGCSFTNLFSKSQTVSSKKPGVELKEEFSRQKEETKTYHGLQAEVMAFADEYSLAVWEGLDRVLKGTTDPEKRVLLQYRKGSLVSSAMRIAAGRNPAANLLDMVVFVTLESMVVKEYWVPEVYGPQAEDLVAVHIRLEKEIWSMAGEVLSPGELQELRKMIEEWRAAHPKQYYVIDVRLRNFSELRGNHSGEAAQKVKSLLGAVEKSFQKFDETILMGERAMFYFERMPRLLSLQTDLMMDQLSAKQDVRQLVDDVNRLTKSFENMSQTVRGLPGTVTSERIAAIRQVTGWLDKEHGRLVADLKTDEPQVKDIVAESRLALTAGNELVKSLDALSARLQAQRNKYNLPPVDYAKTLENASDTARHLQELVAMMNTFVTGEEAGIKPAALSKALNEINTQGKSVLNHIFLLAAGLIFLFLVGLVLALLFYRYLTRRLVDHH